MAEKYRLQFDFTGAAFTELESLKAQLGAASRAEAVRISLGVLRWVLEQQAAGKKILVEKPDNTQQEVVFPFTAHFGSGYKVGPAAAHERSVMGD